MDERHRASSRVRRAAGGGSRCLPGRLRSEASEVLSRVARGNTLSLSPAFLRGEEKMRILSFQPTSTEMAYALGAGRSIVGVSHECTYPAAAKKKPVVSTSLVDPERMTSAEIDRMVVESAQKGTSLYKIDRDLVERLKPDVLLTQSLCEVCATSPSDLREVLQIVKPKPKVLALHAHDFEGMFADLRELGGLLGKDPRPIEKRLRARIDRVVKKTRKLPKRRVFCMEWIDPVFASGHWVPEM